MQINLFLFILSTNFMLLRIKKVISLAIDASHEVIFWVLPGVMTDLVCTEAGNLVGIIIRKLKQRPFM